MKLRDYKREEDYKELARWWESHGWTSVNPDLLPVGIIVYDEDKMLCAGFVYEDVSTPICMMEWIVTNPDNSARESLKAIGILRDSIAAWADENRKVLMTSVKQEALVRVFCKGGFTKTDEGMYNLVRIPKWE